MMFLSLQLLKSEMFYIVTIVYMSLLITELVIIGVTAHLNILSQDRRPRVVLFLCSEVVSMLIFFVAVFVPPATVARNFFFFSGSAGAAMR
ncbi:aminophospholipid translocase, putative [Leishmania tarentolae]|uniref:Aminophospholipid translocase, putative n=1 Tax=Leishmania tarentolae TaxID=5689 RepID=A0A640KY00_LEITA|nr:aminophospholipid translocase, putative [Leishmania tarentolae]